MKKKTGRYLEAIVSSIEKFLITNPKTQIFRNKKLLDRDGVEREVDVYIETIVNRKTLKYAIECKEFSGTSRVEMKDVSNFYDNIANHGIKGIMITTTNFRKNAIKKANNLNIDLYIIKENLNPIIKKYRIYNQRHHVKRAQIHSSHFNEYGNPNLKSIYMGTKKKKYTYKGFMEGYLIGEVEKLINSNRAEIFDEFINVTDEGMSWNINIKKPRTFFGLFDLVYFKQNSKFIPIEKWQVNLDLWIESFEETNPNSFTYYDIGTETSIVNFLTKSIQIASGIKGYMNMIELDNNGEIKIDFVTDNPNEQKNIRFHDFGKFKTNDDNQNQAID